MSQRESLEKSCLEDRDRVLTPKEEQTLNSICYQIKKLVHEKTDNEKIIHIAEQLIRDIYFMYSEEASIKVLIEDTREAAIDLLQNEAKRLNADSFKEYMKVNHTLIDRLINFKQIREDRKALQEFQELVGSLH